MRPLRTFLFLAASSALTGFAHADFDGPAPLAWRWLQPAATAPLSAPLSVGDVLYVSHGEYVYAVDKNTGGNIWRFPAAEPLPAQIKVSPVAYKDTLAVVCDNKVYGFSKDTGAAKWVTRTSLPILGKPTVAGKYFVGRVSNHEMIAVDMETGAVAWQDPYDVPEGMVSDVVGYGPGVVFYTDSGQLEMVNVVQRKPIWQLAFGVIDTSTTPVVLGDNVFLTSGQYLSCVSAISGRGKWQVLLPERLAFGPAASSAGVTAVTVNGSAYMYSLNGQPLNKGLFLGRAPSTLPSAIGRMFVYPTTDGSIKLVDPKLGQVVWSYLIRPTDPNAKDSKGRPVIGLEAGSEAVAAGNTLAIRSLDGSLLAFDKEQGVDLTSPLVRMLSPFPGDELNGEGPMDMWFRVVDDASGVNEDTIKFMIDDKTVPVKYTPDGFIQLEVRKSGAVKGLQDGRRKFTIYVSDWMGNQTIKSFYLIINNQLPPMRLNLPAETPKPAGPGSGGGGGGGAG